MPRILVLVPLLLLAGCETHQTCPVRVSSDPPGARVLVDGAQVDKTPAVLNLDLAVEVRKVRVELEGFEPAEADLKRVSDLDVMTPKEAATTVLCAPCCCGLPLLNFLEPVSVDKQFRPSALDFTLKPLGEGIVLKVRPAATVLVDEVVAAQLPEGGRRHLRFPPGVHQVELRAEGCRPWTNPVEVKAGEYVALDVELRRKGSWVTVRPSEGFEEAEVFDGDRLLCRVSGLEDMSLEMKPGLHVLKVRMGRLEIRREVLVGEQEEILDLADLASAQGPWLGISFRIEEGTVKVTRVAEGSPAAAAGLKEGDELARMDGRPLQGATLGSLKRALAEKAVGDELALEVRRGPAELVRVRVKLAKKPSP